MITTGMKINSRNNYQNNLNYNNKLPACTYTQTIDLKIRTDGGRSRVHELGSIGIFLNSTYHGLATIYVDPSMAAVSPYFKRYMAQTTI